MASATAQHTAVIDWDGTAVPTQWPGRAMTFMPGFARNMRRLHDAGIHIVIFSARLNPYDPFTGLGRPREYVAGEVAYVRDMLDRHGLTFVDIWTKEGKPGGSVYVDDKAERYGGRPGSWSKVTTKILLRLSKEEAEFPPFDQGAESVQ